MIKKEGIIKKRCRCCQYYVTGREIKDNFLLPGFTYTFEDKGYCAKSKKQVNCEDHCSKYKEWDGFESHKIISTSSNTSTQVDNRVEQPQRSSNNVHYVPRNDSVSNDVPYIPLSTPHTNISHSNNGMDEEEKKKVKKIAMIALGFLVLLILVAIISLVVSHIITQSEIDKIIEESTSAFIRRI